jgi:hypothetical protein
MKFFSFIIKKGQLKHHTAGKNIFAVVSHSPHYLVSLIVDCHIAPEQTENTEIISCKTSNLNNWMTMQKQNF